MFSKTMICHIYLFVQIVYFILWNIYIVSNLSGWNTIFSDMQIYRTFIHIVFLADLSDGVAVLWFQVVELWQNPGWLLLEVPFRKIFLQFFSAHSDESHTQINRRYSSVMDILVERSPAHRVHRHSLRNRNIVPVIINLFSQLLKLFQLLCFTFASCVSHLSALLRAVS